MSRCGDCGHPRRRFNASTLANLERWEEQIAGKATSGHRLSLDAASVAGLWKALADAVSEAKWFGEGNR